MAKAQYDRNEVLDKTIDLFRSNGFSASSMQDVVKATGLKPGSIYYSFGNKEELFRLSLERYAEVTGQRLRDLLENSPSVLEGLCIHLENMVQETVSDGYTSCFVVKTQLELAHENNELHKLAGEKLDEVEALIRSYLEREFDEELARDRAASVMLNMFGVRVYGYRDGASDHIRRGLRKGLPWLPWPEEE